MRNHRWLAAIAIASSLYFAEVALAQQWAGIIDSNRAVDWSQVGIPSGIPNRTTICAILNPGATATQINSAIASCPSNQVVYLNAGTYNLTSGIRFSNKSNVTLRGAGADATFLVFNGATNAGGLECSIGFEGSRDSPIYGGGSSGNWTGGYAKGTTQITLSSVAGLSVGSILLLDQLNDSNTDTHSIWVNDVAGVGAAAGEGPSGGQRPGRSEGQMVRVTNINGTTVTITPGISMPNYRSSQSPGFWASSSNIKLSGIENLSLNHTNNGVQAGVIFYNAYNCWVKGVRSIGTDRNHVWLVFASGSSVRDSYFYGTKDAQSESYGIEIYLGSDNLVENNIFQHIAAPIMLNGVSSGSVVSYNYAIDDYYTSAPNYMMGMAWLHAPTDNVLFEGNIGPGWFSDMIHGTHHFATVFRNYWIGWDPGTTTQTNALLIASYGRYYNVIGNVLGRVGTHTVYQAANESNNSVYGIGWGNTVPNDPVVGTTLFRWGNYDTVTATSRFAASEVPSSISPYGNAVPGSQALPFSLYLSIKPSFFGNKVWPPIGPDVTGGDITNVGGHANKIPAQACYETTPIDPAFGSLNVRRFSTLRCYGAPANLHIVP